MNIVIVSTYRAGTRNIGDHLITQASVQLIENVIENANITIIFRAETSEEKLEKLKVADFILVSCLAVRKNLKKHYTFLEKVAELGIPFGIVASGTALPVHKAAEISVESEITKEDVDLLVKLNLGAQFFTTRDILTQWFFEKQGLKTDCLGDVAFVSGVHSNQLNFTKTKGEIAEVAVSDPHYFHLYENCISTLISELCDIFPEAKITFLLHGRNDEFKNYLIENNCEFIEIWKNPQNGLDYYKRIDLHVGYRVHGHVSALARGKPSYLIEQDGRGAGYGLTLPAKISVSGFRKASKSEPSSSVAAQLISALIVADLKTEFVRFDAIATEIVRVRREYYELMSSNLLNHRGFN